MRIIAPEWSGSPDALSNPAPTGAHLLRALGPGLRAAYDEVAAAPLPDDLRRLVERLVAGAPLTEPGGGA